MLVLVKKEILQYFNSLSAYVMLSVFLVATGLLIWVFPEYSILDYGYAGLESLFGLAPYLFMFLIPAITMRSFAEEKKEGTFEHLATSPLSEWDIVFGKYFASVCIVVLALLPTLIYYISVYQLGEPKGNIDSGAVIGSYIGLLLIGSVFSALGLFASSLSSNQMIAFVIAIFLSFVMFNAFDSLSMLPLVQKIDVFVASLGINDHYQSISRGVLDTRDVCYFLSVIVFFLSLTKWVIGGGR